MERGNTLRSRYSRGITREQQANANDEIHCIRGTTPRPTAALVRALYASAAPPSRRPCYVLRLAFGVAVAVRHQALRRRLPLRRRAPLQCAHGQACPHKAGAACAASLATVPRDVDWLRRPAPLPPLPPLLP
eukprot:scaffold72511_cov60-Phaeocystis_antarctica.AAC.2